MASGEVRDVVVRLAVEQTKSKVEVDTSEATKALDDVTKATQDAAGKVTGTKDAFDDLEQGAKEGLQGIKDEFDKLGDAADGLSDRLENIDNLNTTLTETQDAAFKAGEGFKAAGAGALTLARGATLLGFSAEDDLAKFLEKLALIQGAFDVLQGSFDTIKGFTEGMRALRVATDGVTVSQNAAAAATTRFGIALKGVAIAAAPLLAAGAGLAALVAFYQKIRGEAGASADELERFSAAQDSVNAGLEEQRAALDRRRRALLPDDVAQTKLESSIAKALAQVSEIDRERIEPFPEAETLFEVLLRRLRSGPRIPFTEAPPSPLEQRARTRSAEIEEQSTREIRARERLNTLLEEQKQQLEARIQDAGDDIDRIAELERRWRRVSDLLIRSFDDIDIELARREHANRTKSLKSP